MSSENETIEAYERFKINLDNWIQSKNLIQTSMSAEQTQEIEDILKVDITKVAQREALNMSFKLHYYVEYLYSTYNKEKLVLDWCEESLWYIICDKMNNYGDQFTKWQLKYNAAIKENPLCVEINKLRNNVQARVNMLSGRLDNLKRLAEVLHDIGKRYT